MRKRKEVTPKQSSKFVEDFSRHCSDKGITKTVIGVQLFSKSKQYGENYDSIFGKPSSEGNPHSVKAPTRA